MSRPQNLHVRTLRDAARARTQETGACAKDRQGIAHPPYTSDRCFDSGCVRAPEPAVCRASHMVAHKGFRRCAVEPETPSHTISHTPCFPRLCECAASASPKGDGRRVAHATATFPPLGWPMTYMAIDLFGWEFGR
jgi:hypothetical protein